MVGGGVAQRSDADHRAAGQHEHAREHGPPADVLAAPDQHRGEHYRPEGLRRIERGDDADAAAVERLDEARVGEAERDAGCRERGQGRAQLRPQAVAADDQEVEEHDRARTQQRGRRGGERWCVGAPGDVADSVVANCEQRGAGEREHGAEHSEMTGPGALAREDGASGDDERGTCEQQRPERLVEDEQGDEHGDQRCRPDQDRGARGTGVADGQDEEDLGDTWHDRADDEERPKVRRVDPARRAPGARAQRR